MISFNALIYSGVVYLVARLLHGLVLKAGPYLAQAGAWVADFLETRFHAHLPEWFLDIGRKGLPLLIATANDYLTNKNMLGEVFKKLRQNKGNEIAGLLLDYAGKVNTGQFVEVLSPVLKDAINEARTDVVADSHIAAVKASVALLPEKVQPAALATIDREKVKEAVKNIVVAQKAMSITPKETIGRSDDMQAEIEKLRASLPK